LGRGCTTLMSAQVMSALFSEESAKAEMLIFGVE
jgi:hypothetical protein